MRATLLPVVAIVVPMVVLLVMEFRSLSRFEEATVEILRVSAVQATEELSDRIRGDFTPALAHPARQGADAGTAGPIAVAPLPGGASSLASVAPSATALPGRAASAGGPTGVLAPLAAPMGESRLAPATYFALDVDADGRVGFDLDGDALSGTPPVVEVDAGYLAGKFLPQVVSGIRDRRRNLFGGSLLELAVVDDRGREVYRTGPSLGEGFVHETRFPFLVSSPEEAARLAASGGPRWAVRAGYPGTTVVDLARSKTNHQRQLLVSVAFVAGLGIALTARAMAREVKLTDMRSDFISGVSHDLKTPLASIRMFAETLESSRAKSEDKVRQYGKVIGIEAAKLGQLINDMLDFNKIEAGMRRYRMDEVDIREVVEDAVQFFEPQLEEAHFRTVLELPDEPVTFLGNREGLLQVMNNLISNALKFRNEGSGDADNPLNIRLSTLDDNAVIEVEDGGIGIPAADRRKVFEKFYRVIRERDTDAAGTGLGLAIVDHVVRSHGGRIDVEGNRYGGSTFRIELPLWFT